jgi:hypothetical protein
MSPDPERSEICAKLTAREYFLNFLIIQGSQGIFWKMSALANYKIRRGSYGIQSIYQRDLYHNYKGKKISHDSHLKA